MRRMEQEVRHPMHFLRRQNQRLTDRLGRDKQVKFYREAIGYTGG